MPIEISVSIVELPCRRLAHAARWNGSAPHTTTGAARVSDSHCQLVNCHAGTIAIATTGTVSTRETSSRWRRRCTGSSAPTGSAPAVAGGAGSLAPYPADSTTATRSSVATSSPWLTFAFSVA